MRMSKLIKLSFILFSCAVLMWACKTQPRIIGDGFEYLGMTISLSEHLTPNLTESDALIREKVAVDNGLPSKDQSVHFGYFKANNEKMYSYHFWFYSLLSVPVYVILNILDLNVLNFFMITNALLIILAVGWTVFVKGVTPRIRVWMLASFLISPIWFYFTWSHPEIFSFVFVYIGLFELVRNRKKTASLLTGIASLQNPAIILIPAYIIISELIRERKLSKPVIFTGLSASIVILPYLWFYWHYHVFSIIAKVSTSGFSLEKTINLFLDPNMGLVFYIPVVLLTLLYRVFSNDRAAQIWLVLLVMMAAVCSVQANWNSGMSFINRYGVWMIPVFIFALVSFITKLSRNKFLMYGLFSWVITGLIVVYCYASPFYFTEFNPLTKWIMAKVPGIYNPPSEVFVERSIGKELDLLNGTEESEVKKHLPIIYTDEYSHIRKSLVLDKNGNISYVNGSVDLNSNKLTMSTPEIDVSPAGSDIFNEPESFSFLTGWEGIEDWGKKTRWMKGDAKIVLLQNEERPVTISLNIGSYAKPRHAQIIVNGNIVFDDTVLTTDQNIQFKTVVKKKNEIEIKAGSSDSPSGLSLGTDTRKLSLYVNNISIQ
jgi:hypothetical protein